MAGSITFKNYVKRNWKVREDVQDRIHSSDRDQVRGGMGGNTTVILNILELSLHL